MKLILGKEERECGCIDLPFENRLLFRLDKGKMKCCFGKQQKTFTHPEIWTMSQTIQLDVFIKDFEKKYRGKELM